MMKGTTPLLAILLLAPLSGGAATDPSTTLLFDTPARTFHESLPLGKAGSEPWTSAARAASASSSTKTPCGPARAVTLKIECGPN